MLRSRPLLVCVLLWTSIVACGNDGVAARVGDEELTDAGVDAELGAIAPNATYLAHIGRSSEAPIRDAEGEWTRGFVAGVLTRQIHNVVLRDLAADRDVSPTPEHERSATSVAAEEVGGPAALDGFDAAYRRELIDRAALLVAMRADLVDGLTPERFYETHRDDFVKPCTRHLLVATREEAEAAVARIVAGETFQAVARDVSLDEGTAPSGGDLGCNGVGDLLPPLDDASMRQEVGEVGEPISTEQGWQLLFVESRAVPPFEQVKGEAAAGLAELADARVGTALRARFGRVGVEVSGRYGRWDPQERKVVVG